MAGLGLSSRFKLSDLQTEVRPALLELGTQIIKQIYLALPYLQNATSPQLNTMFVDKEVSRRLFTALQQIRYIERGKLNQLDRIIC